MTGFAKTKSLFQLPQGLVYLDGNSLGPMPKVAVTRVSSMMRDEWGDMLITAWNRAGWMNQPSRIGDLGPGAFGRSNASRCQRCRC
jgi:kynureninase